MRTGKQRHKMDQASIGQFSFLSDEQVRRIQQEFGTPTYVYDQRTLEAQGRRALEFPNAYGLTVRYAMKALSNAAVLRIVDRMGIHIDASSGFEAARALRAGVPPGHIQITAQELPADLATLLDQGVLFTACSRRQLRAYGELRPGSEACIRVNPGLGSGHSNRTNTGGPSASYGIWHGHLDEALELAQAYKLSITRIHTHIGSGGDPKVWERCARLSLEIAAQFPDVHTLNLGGGFKVGRMPGEETADVQAIGRAIKADFEAFARNHGRKLHLEIEPGTYLAANAGALVCTVIDVVDTGPKGYNFIKIDSGMNEVLRPSIYGAQHPIAVVPATPEQRGQKDYIVAGRCCESGDILTPEPGNPEALAPRTLAEARIGDALVVGGAGAYCAAMATKNYNSFPEAPEILLANDGTCHLIRQRQTLDQILQNERPISS